MLEIIAPYSVSKLANIRVSRCSGGEAETFTELTDEPETKVDGTYRIDEENGVIYIYTKQSSAYAISYTPCYYVKGSIQTGDSAQEITVTLLDADKQPTEYQLVAAQEDGFQSYSFPKVPRGTYYLQLSWEEYGIPVSCEKKIEVR